MIVLLGAVAICIIGYGTFNNRQRNNYIKKCIIDSYGTPSSRTFKDGEYKHISGYHKNHSNGYEVDDITWNDLDMDSIFMEIDRTQSSAGEEYLYHLLRTPKTDLESIEDFTKNMEPKIVHYMENESERVDMLLTLNRCGRTGKYSIYDYLNNLEIIADENFNQDVWLLLMYGVALFVMFVSFGIGALAMAALLMYGGVTYFIKKRRIEPYIISFAYVFRVINGSELICSQKHKVLEEEQHRLRELNRNMSRFSRFSYLIMSRNSGTGNPLEIILDYIRMFFHLDIIKFFQMRDEINKHWEDIDEMLTIMGQIDCALSIASYRAYLGNYCRPEFEDGDYTAEAIYHPLLKNPVTNDITMNKGIILTGSNASGKSTMLKTVTVAAILAQSIGTVPAASYRAPAYRIYTSLALNDNIFAGESYYMTEIKSLKRILDQGKNAATPVLACVDEVLRGTNTIERISASSVILKTLSQINGHILAATHDLELAELLDEYYDNYHFEETIEGDDILFEYKMVPGMATSRNAIKLLEIVGYDIEITNKANNMALGYEEDGTYKWRMPEG